MKRLASLVLAVWMIFSLAACGTTDPAPTTPDPTTPEAPAETVLKVQVSV